MKVLGLALGLLGSVQAQRLGEVVKRTLEQNGQVSLEVFWTHLTDSLVPLPSARYSSETVGTVDLPLNDWRVEFIAAPRPNHKTRTGILQIGERGNSSTFDAPSLQIFQTEQSSGTLHVQYGSDRILGGHRVHYSCNTPKVFHDFSGNTKYHVSVELIGDNQMKVSVDGTTVCEGSMGANKFVLSEGGQPEQFHIGIPEAFLNSAGGFGSYSVAKTARCTSPSWSHQTDELTALPSARHSTETVGTINLPAKDWKVNFVAAPRQNHLTRTGILQIGERGTGSTYDAPSLQVFQTLGSSGTLHVQYGSNRIWGGRRVHYSCNTPKVFFDFSGKTKYNVSVELIGDNQMKVSVDGLIVCEGSMGTNKFVLSEGGKPEEFHIGIPEAFLNSAGTFGSYSVQSCNSML